MTGGEGGEGESFGEPFDVANEYAQVRVRKVWTRNGERLELSSARAATSIRLDPMELEAVSSWSHADISQGLSRKLDG